MQFLFSQNIDSLLFAVTKGKSAAVQVQLWGDVQRKLKQQLKLILKQEKGTTVEMTMPRYC